MPKARVSALQQAVWAFVPQPLFFHHEVLQAFCSQVGKALRAVTVATREVSPLFTSFLLCAERCICEVVLGVGAPAAGAP